jgi:trehalose 6-phosphate phosphatase
LNQRIGFPEDGPDLSQKRIGKYGTPSALKDDPLTIHLSKSKIAVFLDFDGTLAPIVSDPKRVLLPRQTRKVLESLAAICPVIILSGRDVEYLRTKVGLKNIIYAGSHGFDVEDWNGNKIGDINWDRFSPALDDAEERLQQGLSGIAGVIVERKKFAIAVHYRRVVKSNVARLKRRFNYFASKYPSLKKTNGKKILELLPNVDWDKGRALLWLVDALGLKSKTVPIFIGDDLTDEHGFRAVRNVGVGILVDGSKHNTRARYFLRDSNEVRQFLARLIQIQLTQQT